MSKHLNRRSTRALSRLANKHARPSNGPTIDEQIAQISDLTKTAKGLWFLLLGYMAFVGIALMGIEDADFFLNERQTTLPLVNVAVPTFRFMAAAPVLGALVYIYFHIHLMKLWNALASISPTHKGQQISDFIAPWLISDLALSRRVRRAVRERPLQALSDMVVWILSYLGTPALLLAFWWRSAVPHLDLLTFVACGAPLCFVFLFGYVSCVRMFKLKAEPQSKPLKITWKEWSCFAIFVFAVSLLGWIRTEGTLDQYARKMGVTDETIYNADWAGTPFPKLVSRANLSGLNVSGVPSSWRNPGEDRNQYRPLWCQIRGIPPAACGSVPDADEEPMPAVTFARRIWCQSLDRNQDAECTNHFKEFETQFQLDWQRQWDLKLAALKRFDLRNSDLRFANLKEAQLQGAALGGALMQGAKLNRAQLQGAWLRRTKMIGAILRKAQLQGAHLVQAEMQIVVLWEAHLEGAILKGAKLQGANLGRTKVNAATIFSAANLRGAALREVDYSKSNITQAQIEQVFGDDTVKLPPGIDPPERFSLHYDDWIDFEKAWRAWQKEIGFDPDDPSTW